MNHHTIWICLFAFVATPCGLYILRTAIAIEDHNSAESNTVSASRSTKDENQSNIETQHIPWHLLNFDLGRSSMITSVALEITPEGKKLFDQSGRSTGTLKPTSIMVEGADDVKRAKFAFDMNSCMRLIVPTGVHGGASGVFLIGTLRFRTTEGDFSIGISDMGFSIDGRAPQFETLFYAPAGAEFINMLYCQEHDEMLPEDLVASLGGSAFIAQQRRVLHRMVWTKD